MYSGVGARARRIVLAADDLQMLRLRDNRILRSFGSIPRNVML